MLGSLPLTSYISVVIAFHFKIYEKPMNGSSLSWVHPEFSGIVWSFNSRQGRATRCRRTSREVLSLMKSRRSSPCRRAASPCRRPAVLKRVTVEASKAFDRPSNRSRHMTGMKSRPIQIWPTFNTSCTRNSASWPCKCILPCLSGTVLKVQFDHVYIFIQFELFINNYVSLLIFSMLLLILFLIE